MIPRSCCAYYYGGLPVEGSRRKGRLYIKEDGLHFEVPDRKKGKKIELEIPFSRMEKILLTRDNYYGSDTTLFNLTFRGQAEESFTIRFAPIALFPRRRIALQKQWFDYLNKSIRSGCQVG